MNRVLTLIAAGAATVAVAAPAAAQYPYPQQPYPPQAYPPQAYPGYPQQGYNNQNPISQIINQLLGNRYNVNDRTAVERCAAVAMNQASAQYRPRGYNQQGYYGQPQGYAYGQQGYQGYNQAMMMRVTAITNVERRRNSLRVSGMLDSTGGYAQPPYGNAYGYQNQQGYAQGDLSFRCDVDYRGGVSNVRINRVRGYRR